MNIYYDIRNIIFGAIALFTLAISIFSQPTAVTRTAAGANAAAIQPAVDQFRSELGANNGVGGSFTTGRREINWDGVPDNFAAPNTMPPNFFNANSPRGVVFSTIESGSALNQFAVSADSNNPTSTPVRFSNFNSSYLNTFQTFSQERLFTPLNATQMQVDFFIPGTKIPATVNGFGIIFADVDNISEATVKLYGEDGSQLFALGAPVSSNGLSFVGVTFADGTRIARVVIQNGRSKISDGNTDNGSALDVVAMDDFIYGEPHAREHHANDFDGDGTADLTVHRPSAGSWFVFNSGSNTVSIFNFGQNGDIPIDGDFDGDGRSDIAVYRPETGQWFRLNSSNGKFVADGFGQPGDKPVPGDYDRDGKTDIAVFRPSSNNYFVLRSSNGAFQAFSWGMAGDIPIGAQINQ